SQSSRHCFGGRDKGTRLMVSLIQNRRRHDAPDAILCKSTVCRCRLGRCKVNAMKKDPRFLVFGGLAAVCLTVHGRPCSAQQTPADGTSAQIRAQGYRCDVPVSAERDPALSRPDEAVWILKCQNATYRVRLIPDMAARVEQL